MKKRIIWILAICLIAVAGFGLRLVGLDRRPMHTDEAVQTYITGRLMKDGTYEYDPHEYHGPTLHYFAMFSTWASGAKSLKQTEEFTFRIVPVVFGVATILLLALLAGGISWDSLLWAAALTAASHFMVFYNSYYIHETLLVFFTLALIACGWRYCHTGRWIWAALAGAAAGLMQATKETCIITFAAMAAAVTVIAIWSRLKRGQKPQLRWKLKIVHVVIAIIVAAAVSALLYSSFGDNASGPIDSIRSYFMFVNRAEEAKIHHHPWYFYLKRFTDFHNAPGPWWSERIIAVLALMGFAAAMAGRPKIGDVRLTRFIAFYTLMIAIIYSSIQYKTPWSFMSAVQGIILLAGLGAAAIVRSIPGIPLKIFAVLIIAAGVADLGDQAYIGNSKFYADRRNPYVYAHTTGDVPRMARWFDRLAKSHPGGLDMIITVVSPEADYWPLPWYLRQFDNVGYHVRPPDLNTVKESAIIIMPSDFRTDLPGFVQKGHVGLRPDVSMSVYLKNELWQRFLENNRRQVRNNKTSPTTRSSNMTSTYDIGPLDNVHTFNRDAMATEFTIIICGRDEQYASHAAEAAFEELDRLEEELSRYLSTSDVSRINALSPGETIRLGPAAMECLQTAKRVWRITGGAFDVTVGALVDNNDCETAGEPNVGMQHIVIDSESNTVRVDLEGITVDLGGIGKGYAVDRMSEILAEWGVESSAAGGGGSTVRMTAPPPDKTGWPVLLRDPGQRSRILDEFEMANTAVSGSAMSEKGAHIINPDTLQAEVADRRIIATWAMSPDAAEADALSTAFMVMSLNEINECCRANPRIAAAVALHENGQTRMQYFGRWK